MAATDKLRKGFYGNATTLSAGITNTSTTIPLSSTVGLPTDTGIDIVIDRVDANGNKTPTKQETITVQISGTNGTNAIRGVEGTAQAHSSGAVVEVLFTAATHNDQINHALVQHNQDGTHNNVTATTLAVSGTTTLTGAVTLPNATVKPNNLSLGTAAGYTAGASTTTSTSYGLLADAVSTTATATIGANGLAIVLISAKLANSATAFQTYMSFALSGSNTVAADDSKAIEFHAWASGAEGSLGSGFLLTGLTAGSTVFTLQYRVTGNTGTATYRRISVIPL